MSFTTALYGADALEELRSVCQRVEVATVALPADSLIGRQKGDTVRVIQIPTPRWTAHKTKRFGVKMPDYVPMTVADRAYTSSIWYSPAQ